MAQKTEAWGQRKRRLANRLAAWRAARARPATGFVLQPEPRSIGSVARGRQLVSGNFLFAGYLVEGIDTDIWSLPIPAPRFESVLHGFTWLDDLGAVGGSAGRSCAQGWTWGWIERFRTRARAGLDSGPDRAAPDPLDQSCDLSVAGPRFGAVGGLSRRSVARRRFWPGAGARQLRGSPGSSRCAADLRRPVAGGDGTPRRTLRSGRWSGECESQIDAQGGLPTRNPEELLEVYTLLTWVALALQEQGKPLGPEHLAAMDRTARSLRALRHADGGLARFMAAGAGCRGCLDQSLAEHPNRTRVAPGQGGQGLAMDLPGCPGGAHPSSWMPRHRRSGPPPAMAMPRPSRSS